MSSTCSIALAGRSGPEGITCVSTSPTDRLRLGVGGFAQVFELGVRLDVPIGEEDDLHRFDGRAFQADHRVNPLADARVLFEVPRVDEIQTASVSDAAVDHDDLAVQPQVEADERQPEQSARQCGDDLHAGIAQAAADLPAQETMAAHRVDQHAAGDAPTLGVQQGVDDAVGFAAVGPNVELKMHRTGGGLDIGQKPLEHMLPIVEQVDLLPARAGTPIVRSHISASGL